MDDIIDSVIIHTEQQRGVLPAQPTAFGSYSRNAMAALNQRCGHTCCVVSVDDG
jgi:hypothetical protein